MNTSNQNYIILNKIGIIQTPYTDKAPRQPIANADGTFVLILNAEYSKALKQLDSFKYIYVIYYLDKALWPNELELSKPLKNQQKIGLFASRSPNRPNPFGLSVVKIKKIEKNIIYISGIDAFNGTPLLDIKPYIKKLDAKPDANNGWIDEIEGKYFIK